MSEEMIERHQGDEMIRLTLMDGQVRVMMCETTQMAQRAADIHSATPVCTAAMGRLMTATSMLGVMMKGDNESVTVNVHGDGPMGTIVAVANHGDVKVCADDARVELPLRADGKLDVGGAIGHTGRMTVIKDLGLKEPYVGTIELVSGELGIDFAQYFTVSEQQPSLVSLGVLVNGDVVLKAGGRLVPRHEAGRSRPHAPALSLRMQPRAHGKGAYFAGAQGIADHHRRGYRRGAWLPFLPSAVSVHDGGTQAAAGKSNAGIRRIQHEVHQF